MAIELFAAIDVGSFELELGIYEMSEKIGIREIQHLRHVLALGRDTYNDGKISFELVEEMCGVLQDFTEEMKVYKVTNYKAYASSALREAKNNQIVLDQIFVRTGLRVSPINNSELRFMSYKAVAAHTEEFQQTVQMGTAIIEVGFGSSQISLFDKDVLVSTQNILLGSLRISEMASHWQLNYSQVPEVIEELVENELHTFKKMYLKDRIIKNLIVTGESILYLAKRGTRSVKQNHFTADEFNEFYKEIILMSVDEIEEYYEMDYDYASVMIPSAIIYKKVMDMTGAESIWIPGIRLCDGIAAEYADENHLVKFYHDFTGDILSSARSIAKRYKCHTAHTQEMERLVVMIFNATKRFHGLGSRERLLLQISAILHASGKFVSIMKGTDSSYQIIMATEIIGISHLEREIVANVVRYNMQEYAYNQVALNSGLPQYKGMDESGRDITILIAKLTAILRLANSMDRSHKQKLSDCKMAVKGENLVITTGYIGNMVLEQSSFEQKADFFEEIFGIRPILKQKRRV